MIKFLLVLYFEMENVRQEVHDKLLDVMKYGPIADKHIEKMVEMPLIPRIGEYIVIGGNKLEVNSVEHFITPRMIAVRCDIGLSDGIAAYAEDSEGWNLDALSPAGQEIFFRWLKQYRNSGKIASTPI